MGREKSAGAAILYGTTRVFLEKFGLKSVRDLPPLEDYAPDEATRQFIRERLSSPSAKEQPASAEDEQAALSVLLSREDGQPEEVDRGEDEREDDPAAMSELLAQAITEKAGFEEPLR